MAHDSLGTHNQPHYSSSGAPADAPDLTEVSDYAATVGNAKSGTTTQMNALAGADVWQGLVFSNTTDSGLYVYQGSAFARYVPKLSHAEFTTSVTGLPDGTSFSAHTVTADATNTTDSAFVSIVSSAARLQPGIYALQWITTNSVAYTGVTVLAIAVAGTTQAQHSVGTGTTTSSVELPNLLVTAANTDVTFVISKTCGGTSNVTGRIRVTKISA